MKAKNLNELWKVFDPKKPLMDEDLDKYYVEIPYSHINEIKTRLTLFAEQRKPSKMLFTGHRGCGKTSALYMLMSQLGKEFFVVYYSVFESLDINDVSYIDVLLSIVTKIVERAEDEKVKLSKDVKDRLDKWGMKIIETAIKEKTKEKRAGIGLKVVFLDLLARIKNEETTRREIRKEIDPKITELIDIINDIITDIEKFYKNKKHVLVIVDDLEKTDPEKAKKIFYEHSTQLTQPKCHIIYTIPIALHYSRESKPIDISFDGSYAHPNVGIFNKDGSKSEQDWNNLKTIIEKRTSLDLFEPDALDHIIKESGGVIREMVRIIQDSATEGIIKGKNKIDLESVNAVIREMTNTYRKQLSEEDYDILKEIVNGKKDVRRDEKLVGLLHNLSVLEYRNEEVWCDVNPIIKQFLE